MLTNPPPHTEKTIVLEPGLLRESRNLAAGLVRWSMAGFPVCTDEEVDARETACLACEHWDGAARLHLGKCKHPSCGCTKLKWLFKTERCPVGKWATIKQTENV